MELIKLTITNKNENNREMPHTHFLLFFVSILFALIVILDVQIWKISKFIQVMPFLFRFFMSIIFIGLAIYLTISSHNAIFSDHHNIKESLITNGILSKVRNPMYLGLNLFYWSIIAFTLSLLGFFFWLIVFLSLFQRMVRYEEKSLEHEFGNEFRQYMTIVPRWIPKMVRKNVKYNKE
jgi:protein-S-isoprenylcysteine O-methyltransferase Ste14